MTEKFTDSEQSRRTFVKGTVATGAGVAGLASLGSAAANSHHIQDITAVQRGAGLVVVQVQVVDAVDIDSIDITLIELDGSEINVVRNVANNNVITVPIQVSGVQVGAQVIVAVLSDV